MAYRKAWLQPQGGPQGFMNTMKTYGGRIPITALDVTTTGNVVGLFMIPANFCVVDMVGPTTGISGFGTACVIAIGDPGNTARYATAVAANAAAAIPAIIAANAYFKTTQDTEIQMLVSTQASAPAAGTLELYLRGFIYA